MVLKYWTANLVTGDTVFRIHDDGQISLTTVTSVTETTFTVAGIVHTFDKLTAQNSEGAAILPDDAEQREKYECQARRATLSALNPETLSEVEIRYMLGAFSYARGDVNCKICQSQGRQQPGKIRIAMLTDREVSYVLAGLRMAIKTREKVSI